MTKKNIQLDGLNALLSALVFALLIMFAPTIFFAIRGDKLGVAISLTIISMLFLGVMIMGAVAIGSAWTRNNIRDGANIALQSQGFNDKWDAAKMRDTQRTFALGVQSHRALKEPESALTPFPSQGVGWRPELDVLQEGDIGDGPDEF